VERTFARAESFAAQLSRDLERCAAAHGAMAAIIAELAERRERAISDRRNI
jgi:hypothetical protein